jgi:hypothetical protein
VEEGLAEVDSVLSPKSATGAAVVLARS